MISSPSASLIWARRGRQTPCSSLTWLDCRISSNTGFTARSPTAIPALLTIPGTATAAIRNAIRHRRAYSSPIGRLPTLRSQAPIHRLVPHAAADPDPRRAGAQSQEYRCRPVARQPCGDHGAVAMVPAGRCNSSTSRTATPPLARSGAVSSCDHGAPTFASLMWSSRRANRRRARRRDGRRRHPAILSSRSRRIIAAMIGIVGQEPCAALPAASLLGQFASLQRSLLVAARWTVRDCFGRHYWWFSDAKSIFLPVFPVRQGSVLSLRSATDGTALSSNPCSS
jgi:hypothetical protein